MGTRGVAPPRTSDLGGRGRVRARPLHGGSVASQRHIRHHRCWCEAYAARQGRRRPVSGPVAPNSAQNLPPAAFDRLSATDCSRERPKWPSPHAERLGTLHIHTKCKLALIFGDHNCIARASHTPVSFCRHARVTGVRFRVRSRLYELTVARPLILMRSEPGLRILRRSSCVG